MIIYLDKKYRNKYILVNLYKCTISFYLLGQFYYIDSKFANCSFFKIKFQQV